jgi:hypothetical protein
MNTLFDAPAAVVDDRGDADVSRWTRLPFGKHKGKTLPQVMCSDPAWFLWAVRDDVFEGRHAQEATVLDQRVRGIIIPKRRPKRWVVEYCYDVDRRFMGFDIVRRTDHPYLKYNSQSDYLNIALVRVRYPGEWSNFIRDFRWHLFGGQKMTKERCEQFFGDQSRFVNS